MATSSSRFHAQPNPALFAQPRPARGLAKHLDHATDWLTLYWAHALTVFLGFLVFSALSVPVLSYLGLDVIAKPIFYSLHYVCAQIPSHSFYVLGHQLGMCARNFSIYASMFVGCLFFVLNKKQMRGIPWWLWILMMAPMAWDGTTQMFGLRESDWILRMITGILFGLGNIWFALPLMQKSLDTPVPSPALMAAVARQQKNRAIPLSPMMLQAAMQPVPATPPLVNEANEAIPAPTLSTQTAGEDQDSLSQQITPTQSTQNTL